MDIVTFKHSANSGDLIASLPGMQHIYKETGKKCKIYQRIGLKAHYYQGASHPVKDSAGFLVCMNEFQWNLLVPLLLSLPYVDSCEIWEGQNVDIDLDKIRSGDFSTMGFGSINRWQWYVHPLLACDLSKPWINVDDNDIIKERVSGKVIINLTERYRNPLITYFFLKKWEHKLIFSGTIDEYNSFCKENNLDIPYLNISNFLELSQAIKHCKFGLLGQSMIWNIFEAMKKLRILEVCRQASNCIPNGADGYDFLHQEALEIYFNKFIKL